MLRTSDCKQAYVICSGRFVHCGHHEDCHDHMGAFLSAPFPIAPFSCYGGTTAVLFSHGGFGPLGAVERDLRVQGSANGPFGVMVGFSPIAARKGSQACTTSRGSRMRRQ